MTFFLQPFSRRHMADLTTMRDALRRGAKKPLYLILFCPLLTAVLVRFEETIVSD
jgi:hypothetical protein